MHAKRRRTDTTLYCERCGISFLWTSEEQSLTEEDSSPAQPVHCPGCRHLLPRPSRERGLVKWFSPRKQYGFIARADQSDLFVHRTGVAAHARLRPGDLVEFEVGEGRRGPAAVEVRLLRPHSAPEEGAGSTEEE